ncbi:MAG TPA: L,D-transpeptidase [Actinophytocola sp.]|jgi:lipoprotein-anchoring transpeptidase ErfK/SrfK|uniref:L,D-transpeptidase n=1 Tax=Actinophytocola sp. TaxID=1872138 RepID=UPI002F946833
MGKLRKIVGTAVGAAALTAVTMVVAPAAADASPPPCGRTTAACIDLSTQQAWLMHNGRKTYGPVRITTGRPGYRTPIGMYKVQWKDIDHWSHAYNAPMPYSVFFTSSGIAFHEGSLSVPSHGCVHLSHAAAVKFFNVLKVGNVVMVHA